MTTDTQSNPLVLVADDDDLTRDLISQVLSESGFTIVEASNGNEAIEKTCPVFSLWRFYSSEFLLTLAESLRFQSSVNVERARNFPQYRSLLYSRYYLSVIILVYVSG